MVVTENGVKPIRELCGSEGRVLSSDGNYHSFFDARKTQTNVPVFKLTMEDGSEIIATPNHRFMRRDGSWARLDELREGEALYPGKPGRCHTIHCIGAAGRADVYNMEVEETHDFVLENGVVAHNCYDDCRYMCMAYPLAAKGMPKHTPPVFDPYSE